MFVTTATGAVTSTDQDTEIARTGQRRFSLPA